MQHIPIQQSQVMGWLSLSLEGLFIEAALDESH